MTNDEADKLSVSLLFGIESIYNKNTSHLRCQKNKIDSVVKFARRITVINYSLCVPKAHFEYRLKK